MRAAGNCATRGQRWCPFFHMRRGLFGGAYCTYNEMKLWRIERCHVAGDGVKQHHLWWYLKELKEFKNSKWNRGIDE